MLLGGGLALGIAWTRVVLPYDEVWCSTTRAGLAAINPRLLPFLAHDRVTLAGTMISIGGLYLGLVIGAVRLGAHWAQRTVIYSATAGFLSFFLFLGFGYFDPWHLTPAFVGTVIFGVAARSSREWLCDPHAAIRSSWRTHLESERGP